jgi:hypothetical protein
MRQRLLVVGVVAAGAAPASGSSANMGLVCTPEFLDTLPQLPYALLLRLGVLQGGSARR